MLKDAHSEDMSDVDCEGGDVDCGGEEEGEGEGQELSLPDLSDIDLSEVDAPPQLALESGGLADVPVGHSVHDQRY